MGLSLAMNSADYVMIAVVVLSAIVGAVRGFVREAIALGAWIVALFAAWHFSDLIAPHLGGLLAAGDVKPWAARVIIVALILLLGAGIGAIMGHYVRLSMFSGMDRLLGFVFGAARGVVLIAVFVVVGQLLKLDGELWWRHSLLLPYGNSLANGLLVLVGAGSSR